MKTLVEALEAAEAAAVKSYHGSAWVLSVVHSLRRHIKQGRAKLRLAARASVPQPEAEPQVKKTGKIKAKE